MKRNLLAVALLTLVTFAPLSRSLAAEPPVVSFASLLDEMVDREAMARWPDPPFTLKQASSYDRRSKTPGNADWFANVDWSNFIRSEKVKTAGGERTEHVMLDETGPGAIVRIWVGGFTDRGVIRFYIDGAAEPVISGTADELIGGPKVFPEPFAATRARGRNLYAPIPYAKQIKVTYDGPLPKKFGNPGGEGFWYNINYRTYPAGTKVESFSLTALRASANHVAGIGERLRNSRGDLPTEKEWETQPSDDLLLDLLVPRTGPGAIQKLTVQLKADDLQSALRNTTLTLDFDHHHPQSTCPVGEFFGTGVGINPAQDAWRVVEKDGRMTCYWVMPYKKSCRIRLKTRGKQKVAATVGVTTRPWQWDDRSLYFHAAFRRDPAIDTGKKSDFNYITIGGRGVYMGDTLAVFNPQGGWWGEGDEKIFVDEEKFPSHFGTGSEDYYGYAWGNTDVFNSPFHSQPRAGRNNQGHTTNSRVRMLDRIPFSKSLQVDMEVWHWKPTKVDYSVATFWYGDADNKTNASLDEKLLLTVPGREAK